MCPCLESPPPPKDPPRPTVRGAAGLGLDPWCDPTPPPPSRQHRAPGRGQTWHAPPAAHAPTHTGTAVSPSRQRLDEVRGSSAVWTAVRPHNQRGVPSRASEVRAHWPWVTTFGASRDPTQPNPLHGATMPQSAASTELPVLSIATSFSFRESHSDGDVCRLMAGLVVNRDPIGCIGTRLSLRFWRSVALWMDPNALHPETLRDVCCVYPNS